MKLTIIPALLLALATIAVTRTVAAQDRFFGVDLGADQRNFLGERPEAAVRSDLADDDRYLTPRQLIQRRAAWEAQQRRERLAAAKRLGYSPSRPPASPIPMMSGPNYLGGRIYYAYPGVFFFAPSGPPIYGW